VPAAAAPGEIRRLHDHLKLREWREASGLTRLQVCALTGLSYQWLSALEGGWNNRQPSLETLVRLAELYGRQPGELLLSAAA
jgi:transcriptional regulator with XRE-family HTH domain